MTIKTAPQKEPSQPEPVSVFAGLAVAISLIGVLALFVFGWWLRQEQQTSVPINSSFSNSIEQPVSPQDLKSPILSQPAASDSVRSPNLNAGLTAVDVRKIAEDQSLHLREKLRENEALPEEDRSPLAPKASTIQAVASGRILLQ